MMLHTTSRKSLTRNASATDTRGPAVRPGDFEGVAVTRKYLRILAVDRDRRRRGIGSALLRDAEGSARA
jgi:GNAT superfamily N-acetyltransferase